MHRHRIFAQISLILSILNLVLAAPIVVREIHEARGDGIAMSKKSDDEESEAASDRQTSLPPSPDAMASPQHSSLSDGSAASSGYPGPYLSSASSSDLGYLHGYSWLVDRPPRPSMSPDLQLQTSSYESAALHASSSVPPETPLPLLQWLPSPSGSVPSELSEVTRMWLEHGGQMPSSPSHYTPTETSADYSPPDGFTPSHPPSSMSLTNSVSEHSYESMTTPFASASDGSLSSQYFSASDGLAPSHNSISESPPPENAKFFNEKMIKKLKIVAAVIVTGSIISAIAGSQIKHRDCQDS